MAFEGATYAMILRLFGVASHLVLIMPRRFD